MAQLQLLVLFMAISFALAQDECISRSEPCGARQCGPAHDGCGGIVICGSCASNATCLSSGLCRSLFPTVDDVASVPYRSASVFDVAPEPAGSLITSTTVDVAAGVQFLRWDNSADLISDSGTTVFKAQVMCGSPDSGVVGLGLRLGQAAEVDGIWFGIECSSTGEAEVKVHLSVVAVASEYSLGRAKWSSSDFNQISISHKIGEELIEATISINGNAFQSCAIPVIGFPDPGALFFVASGSGSMFSQITVTTSVSLSFALEDCTAAALVKGNLSYLLGVDPTDIDLTPIGGSEECSNGYILAIRDLTHQSARQEISSTTLASALGLRIQELVADNALDSVGLSVADPVPIVPSISADAIILALPLAAASGVLSTGMIIGIAAGGASTLALVGAVAGLTVFAVKRRSNKTSDTLHQTGHQRAGIDVMSNITAPHVSITARAPPISVA